jgi:citrate synthase
MSVEVKPGAGLEDVVAGESAICYLDGARGVLAYQGYDIHELANAERGASFEEVCFLLWHGRLPTRPELGDLQTQLVAGRAIPDQVIRAMRSLPKVDGMDALRTLTSMLGHYDQDAGEMSPHANYRKAVRLTAQVSSLVAAWGRSMTGGSPIDPHPASATPPTFCTC